METQMKIAIIGGLFALIVAITQIIIPTVIHSQDPMVPPTPIVLNVTPLVPYSAPVGENIVKDSTKSPLSTKTLLFSDYFSDSNSGWSTFPNSQGCKIYYDNGKLKFDKIDNNSANYVSNQEDFTPPRNFIVEVDTTTDGSDFGEIGIMLRLLATGNYYTFYIDNKGTYIFAKYSDNDIQIIIPWTESPFINKGAATNTIKIKCEEDTFTFYINGNEINSCTDTTFPTGDIALIAGSNGYNTGKFSFDNFRVWSISSAN
jgi:hypothetical protein